MQKPNMIWKNVLDLIQKNIKALKRLALINIYSGNYGDAESLFQKCINFEPKDQSHKDDLLNVRNLIKNLEELDKFFGGKDYVKSEELARTILDKSEEFFKD